VITFTPLGQILNDPVELGNHATQIPYYALNFAPTLPATQYPLAVYAVAMLDNVQVAQSQPTYFTLVY
jgi:hypothetical protein